MARADAAAIAAGTSAEILMERAGRAVARAAIRAAGGRYGKRVLVVCGKGNNGGDGFVAARLLRREGMTVTCLTTFDPSGATAAAAAHLARFRNEGGTTRRLAETAGSPAAAQPAGRGAEVAPVRAQDASAGSGAEVTFGPSSAASAGSAGEVARPRHGAAERSLGSFDVAIDALFGTGFTGALEGEAAAAVDLMANVARKVVAVDIPSGIDGTTGAVSGPAVRADVTVALGAEKVGAALDGTGRAGSIEVVDIGIPIPDASVHVVERSDVAGLLPARKQDLHKGSAGAVAILAGSMKMTGAALLCARGADRGGAGYVRVGSLLPVKEAVAQRLPEVLVQEVGERWDAAAWEVFEHDAERSDALVLGPGLGTGDGECELVMTALERSDLPIVLDADGLNNLAASDRDLPRRDAPVVMTPHPGEMARLLDTGPGEVQKDRLGAARAAAERFGCTVLLKGPRTIVATPYGTAYVNPTGSPALATAGSGDVLAGVLGALLAAGAGPAEAAYAAAYLHGLAGEIATEERGTTGAVAWDFAEALPAAIRRVQHG